MPTTVLLSLRSSAWPRRCTSTPSVRAWRPLGSSRFCAHSAARGCRATTSADQCWVTTSPLYSRRTKDRVPRGHVVGVEPTLDLPSVAIREDAHHAGGDRYLRTSRSYLAKRAHMRVVAEHVVLPQPEANCAELAEEADQGIAPTNVTGKRMCARDVPHDVGVDKLFNGRQIVGAKSVNGLPIDGGIRVLVRGSCLAHGAVTVANTRRNASKLSSDHRPSAWKDCIAGSEPPAAATAASHIVRSTSRQSDLSCTCTSRKPAASKSRRRDTALIRGGTRSSDGSTASQQVMTSRPPGVSSRRNSSIAESGGSAN